MSEKPKVSVFSQLLERILPSEKPSTHTRYCEKGHPMDPNWTKCAYCDAEKRKNEKSINQVNTKSDEIKGSETTQRSPAMERGRTKISMDLPEEPSETKKLDTSPDEVAERKVVSRKPRITGVLSTFSHTYTGELFILYEGKNVIGRAPSCAISIASDGEMSDEHATILCRAGRDELHDMLSTNGTFLNEEYVETKGAELADGAMIRTGRTVFEFRKITSGSAGRGAKGPGQGGGYVKDNNGSHDGEPEI